MGRKRLPQRPERQADSLGGTGHRPTALADVYDALRSSRAYKPPFSHEQAVEIITRGDGRVEPGHFSPEVLLAFIRRSGTFREIFETMKDREFSPGERELSPDRS